MLFLRKIDFSENSDTYRLYLQDETATETIQNAHYKHQNPISGNGKLKSKRRKQLEPHSNVINQNVYSLFYDAWIPPSKIQFDSPWMTVRTPIYTSGTVGVCACAVQSLNENTKKYSKTRSKTPEPTYMYFSMLATWLVPAAQPRNLSKIRNSQRLMPGNWHMMFNELLYGTFVYSPTRTRLPNHRNYKLTYWRTIVHFNSENPH